MARAYSADLRERVITAIENGLSTRKAAAQFSIGIATAGAWHRLWRKTGSVDPARQGHPGGSQLDAHEDLLLELIAERHDITLDEMAAELVAQRDVSVHPTTIWYFLNKRGITYKKRRPMRQSRNAQM